MAERKSSLYFFIAFQLDKWFCSIVVVNFEQNSIITGVIQADVIRFANYYFTYSFRRTSSVIYSVLLGAYIWFWVTKKLTFPRPPRGIKFTC